MMEHQVTSPPGAKRRRRRVGRGDASGHGSFSGRGMKDRNHAQVIQGVRVLREDRCHW